MRKACFEPITVKGINYTCGKEKGHKGPHKDAWVTRRGILCRFLWYKPTFYLHVPGARRRKQIRFNAKKWKKK